MVFKDKIFIFLILGLVIIAFFVFNLSRLYRDEFLIIDGIQNDFVKKGEPIYSKGIYLTSYTAESKRADELLELIKRTELNTVVIDVKNYTGRIAFDTDSELINELGSEKISINNIEELVNKFHEQGIYTIARIVVFEDNYLPRERPDLALKKSDGSLWQDFKGLTWLDPASKEVWDYNIALAREAVKIGFDEINLDYIRFPSDGDISQIRYPFWDVETPKREVIRQFFEYFSQKLRPMGVYLSADLFGLTLTSTTDLNIGQWLEYAGLYFDYICPMVYPSHYPEGYEGFSNPAAHPYEVIYDSLVIGMGRLASVSGENVAKLRPWLQDFDMGADYDAKMINLQKQAVYDAGAYGWLLWNPKNIYTEDALLKD